MVDNNTTPSEVSADSSPTGDEVLVVSDTAERDAAVQAAVRLSAALGMRSVDVR